jgi:hypothetical protein
MKRAYTKIIMNIARVCVCVVCVCVRGVCVCVGCVCVVCVCVVCVCGVCVCVWCVCVCARAHTYMNYFETSICLLCSDKLFNDAEAKDPP